mmetsp:Transcript_35953/g.78735  ORF Transcript_35953/g.78735 Transcript_35953/m.78735 type:complete len:244 (-) Transcript_35953:1137-1868(-)
MHDVDIVLFVIKVRGVLLLLVKPLTCKGRLAGQADGGPALATGAAAGRCRYVAVGRLVAIVAGGGGIIKDSIRTGIVLLGSSGGGRGSSFLPRLLLLLLLAELSRNLPSSPSLALLHLGPPPGDLGPHGLGLVLLRLLGNRRRPRLLLLDAVGLNLVELLLQPSDRLGCIPLGINVVVGIAAVVGVGLLLLRDSSLLSRLLLPRHLLPGGLLLQLPSNLLIRLTMQNSHPLPQVCLGLLLLGL